MNESRLREWSLLMGYGLLQNGTTPLTIEQAQMYSTLYFFYIEPIGFANIK